MPLNPALGGRGRGRLISEFEARLVWKVSFRTARSTQKNLPQKHKLKKKNLLVIQANLDHFHSFLFRH